MNKRIAIIDDEPDIVELVSLHLTKAGYAVDGFYEAEKFLQSVKKKTPDLIILDLMLPDMDGLEICKHLRRDESLAMIPIIMLTAKTDETDKIVGLEIGADDYITKPFSPKEVVARVKALLRRTEREHQTKKIKIGSQLVIDLERHEVLLQGKKLELTPTEFKILQLLTNKKGIVFSREQILDYVWGQEKVVVDRTVDVHINHLRDKLGSFGEHVKNIRGIGYKFEL